MMRRFLCRQNTLGQLTEAEFNDIIKRKIFLSRWRYLPMKTKPVIGFEELLASLPDPKDMSKAEILDLLLREEYGYLPDAPDSVEVTLSQKEDNKFPYWFCENYKKYASNEAALPFDQHYLTDVLRSGNYTLIEKY